jgi:iron complex outermembrane receptor protein
VSLQDVAFDGGGALLNSPKLLGKLNLSGPLPWAGLRAGYELRFDSRRLTLDGSRLGGYAVSNLQLATDVLGRGLELSLGVQNLFDKRYAHPGADTNWQNSLEQDGRSVRLSLTGRF